MKKVCINMCDIGFGADRLGIQHGYVTIKERKPNLASKLNYIPYKLFAEDMKLTNKKYYQTIYHTCFDVYQANLECFEKGAFPILIGGDHSLALGSVKASMKAYPNEDIGVIWIDAHTDINTFETTITGHIHGMPIAGLLGINDKKYNDLGNSFRIKPENIIYFGTRSIDYEEEIILEKLNILNIKDSIIKANGLNKQIEKSIDYLKNKVSKIHISLDLDSINPYLIKGVSTPEKGGLKLEEPFEIIKGLANEFDVVSLDIVEYNPAKDIDNKTLDYLVNLIEDIEDLFSNK